MSEPAITTAHANISAVYSPQFPAVKTQPARLLAALLRGRKINPLDGWRCLGIYRLSDTVLQLRKRGWLVITGRLDVRNRFNEDCHVALYHLPKEVIEAVGLGAIEFIAEAERDAAKRRATT